MLRQLRAARELASPQSRSSCSVPSIVAKIGPIVASIIHVAVEVIRIAVLAAGAVLASAVTVWLTVMIVRWWLHHHGARRQAVLQPARTAAWQHMAAGDQPGCLACGGSGRVLRAISGGRYQAVLMPGV